MRQKNKLTNQDLFHFCEQFSILLHSGISCAEGFQLMMEDSKIQEGKDFFQTLSENFEQNGSLAQTLQDSGRFPDSMISYIKIGEETGCLDEVLKSLSEHYEQELEISETIKSAVTYPLLMLAMMGTVIVILLVKVLPVFKQVFQQMGLEINHFSNGLLSVGTLISRYSAVFLCIVLLILAGFLVLFFTDRGRTYLKQISGRLPYIREIAIAADYARLTQAIAMGIHSGIDQVVTLEMAQDLLSQQTLIEKTAKAREILEEGAFFEDAMSSSGLFEGMEARLITVGVRAGATDEVMNNLARRYRESSLAVTGNIISIVEPTIVILFSLLVGVVLLSVMMPLLGILSEIVV